jgi:hypothetical protein
MKYFKLQHVYENLINEEYTHFAEIESCENHNKK